MAIVNREFVRATNEQAREQKIRFYESVIDSAIALLDEDAFLEAWMLLKDAREVA